MRYGIGQTEGGLRWTGLGRWVLAALALGVAPAFAQALVVYDDALQNGFEDFSYGGGSDFLNPIPVHSGNASISFNGNNFNALSFAHPSGSFNTSIYPTLHFWVHGGTAGGQQLRLIVQHANTIVADAELESYVIGGAIGANQWREVNVPFGQAPLGFAGAFDRIDLQSDIGGTQPVMFVDDMALLAVGDEEIFADGFDNAGLPPPQNGLVETHNVAIDGMLGDRFSWQDAAGQPRAAVLAQNNGASGPGGTRGGELREFRYQVGGATRIVRAPASGAGGFGYVVSHRYEGTDGIPGDDSPLGHGFPGTFHRVFEGRHHAIFRFTQTYPRYSRTDANPPNHRYDVPVTIDWMFSTGRNDPVWSITWDLHGVPVNALNDDSRAPYGELLFDGAANAGAASTVAGVGWGDRYRFASTTNPVTYNSAWTWNVPNTIPYVKLWTTAVDATMGSVQTRTIVQQDAGGYYGTNRWNTTSAAGHACTVPIGGVDTVMPCAFNWPFQSINYSLNPFSPNTPTDNTRLAWGTNFGFLGQASYYTHGSAYYGGPFPNTTASGWPKKSYSTYVVLGKHSTDAVATAVTQTETVQTLTLTASVGSVATSGPAGIVRSDTLTYQPAGYDPVYGALTFVASGNALDANVAVGSGTLRRPLLVIRNYSGDYPGSLSLNGAVLTVDVDFFPSLRADTHELWITLNRDLSGATGHIKIMP